jgi:hypothetical protein
MGRKLDGILVCAMTVAMVLLGLVLQCAADVVVLDCPGKSFPVDDGVKDATGKYRASATFTTGGQEYRIDAVPASPVQANEAKSTVDFMNVLKRAFKGWTFNYTDGTGKDLALPDKSLVVGTYDVKTGIQEVAMQFYVNYDITKAPKGSALADKTKLHWIQVELTNWPLKSDHKPLYTVLKEVDNKGNKKDPYYDSVFAANFSPPADDGNPNAGKGLPYLKDTPHRDDATLKNYDPKKGPVYEYFETFLVVQTAAKTDDIYDGVQWGWSVQAIPEPGVLSLSLCMTLFGTLTLLCSTRRPRVCRCLAQTRAAALGPRPTLA